MLCKLHLHLPPRISNIVIVQFQLANQVFDCSYPVFQNGTSFDNLGTCNANALVCSFIACKNIVSTNCKHISNHLSHFSFCTKLTWIKWEMNLADTTQTHELNKYLPKLNTTNGNHCILFTLQFFLNWILFIEIILLYCKTEKLRKHTHAFPYCHLVRNCSHLN